MILKKLSDDFTVCKLADVKDIPATSSFYFVGRTDEEISLVCRTEETPENTTDREDGWSAFRIEGVLDFPRSKPEPGLRKKGRIPYLKNVRS